MIDELEGADDDEEETEAAEGLGLEIDSRTQIFLEMRQQNLDLLKVAAQVAGYAGGHPPLKPHDYKNALKSIWEVYSEFYSWVDPEESDEDEEEGDDEE